MGSVKRKIPLGILRAPRLYFYCGFSMFLAVLALGERWSQDWCMDSSQTGHCTAVPGWWPSLIFVGLVGVLVCAIGNIVLGMRYEVMSSDVVDE